MAFGEAEGDGRDGRGAGHHEHEGKGGHVIAPRRPVIEPVDSGAGDESNDPQDQQREGYKERHGKDRRHGGDFASHVAGHCPRVGEDPHPAVVVSALASRHALRRRWGTFPLS